MTALRNRMVVSSISQIFSAALLLLSVGCSLTGEERAKETADRIYQAEGFCITVDATTEVETERAVEDYTIYRFSSSAGTYLYAYEGNQPSFPRLAQDSRRAAVVKFGEHAARCIRSADGYECLFELDKSIEFPRFVHFWYESQSDAQTQLADSVIASFSDRKGDE